RWKHHAARERSESHRGHNLSWQPGHFHLPEFSGCTGRWPERDRSQSVGSLYVNESGKVAAGYVGWISASLQREGWFWRDAETGAGFGGGGMPLGRSALRAGLRLRLGLGLRGALRASGPTLLRGPCIWAQR